MERERSGEGEEGEVWRCREGEEWRGRGVEV